MTGFICLDPATQRVGTPSCRGCRDTSIQQAFVLGVTGLRAIHKLSVPHQLCVQHLLSINQISVGGLTANEYA
jgi:hypothetical protein